MRNRGAIDMFEPGSTMKPFTVSAALETGQYTPNTIVNTSPGSMRLGWHTIRDTHNYGALTVSGVIIKSSNVGSAKLRCHFLRKHYQASLTVLALVNVLL